MSVDELLKAVDDLNELGLESLVSHALFVRSRRKSNVLPAEETALMREIQQGIPSALNDHYEALLDKRDDEDITEAEYAELLEIGDQIEAFGVKRIEALAKLATIRQVSLTQIMDDMGIQSPGIR